MLVLISSKESEACKCALPALIANQSPHRRPLPISFEMNAMREPKALAPDYVSPQVVK